MPCSIEVRPLTISSVQTNRLRSKRADQDLIMSIAGALTAAQPGENRIPFASRDLVEFGVA